MGGSIKCTCIGHVSMLELSHATDTLLFGSLKIHLSLCFSLVFLFNLGCGSARLCISLKDITRVSGLILCSSCHLMLRNRIRHFDVMWCKLGEVRG